MSIRATTGQAAHAVGRAAEWVSRFPRLAQLAASGEVSNAMIHRILLVTRPLTDVECSLVEEDLLPILDTLDPSKVTSTVRRIAERIGKESLEAAATKEARTRSLRICPGEDGLTQWNAWLPTPDSAILWSAITTRAKELQTEARAAAKAAAAAADRANVEATGERLPRTGDRMWGGQVPSLDQARADALLDLALSDVRVSTTVNLGLPVMTSTGGVDPLTAMAMAGAFAEPAPFREDPAPSKTTMPTRSTDSAPWKTTTEPGPPAPTPLTDTAPADTATWPEAASDVDPSTELEATIDDVAALVDEIAGWDLTDSYATLLSPLDAAASVTGGAPWDTSGDVSGAWVSRVEVPAVGWIPAHAVATLITALPLELSRALLATETGVTAETTVNAYRTPARMREFVIARDGTCRFPGCTRPARAFTDADQEIDLDHAVPWPRGQTRSKDLTGKCRRHHRAKQQKRWTHALDPDTGAVTWTTPHGQVITSLPMDHLGVPLNRPRPSPDLSVPKPPVPKPSASSGSGQADDPPPF